ncbi:MAG: GNAT family N-acetyltransferase [Desulfobacteraceae bacterium]|nr:GNAT family N-acetyltransferase [Desulfobacteraceae bacterium]
MNKHALQKKMSLVNEEYCIKIFQGIEGFRQIKEDWQHLLKRIPKKHFFHYPEWYESYLFALEKKPDNTKIFAFYKEHRLEAILPFKQIHIGFFGIGLTILEVPEHNHLIFRDIVAGEEIVSFDIYTALLRFIRNSKTLKGDIVRIRNVFNDSFALSALNLYSNKMSIKNHVTHCKYIMIEPFDTMFEKISKKRKKGIRNLQNKLSRMGKVTFHTDSSHKELMRGYPHFLKIEASGWKGQQGTAIRMDKRLIKFYRCLIESFSKRACCEINSLWLDKKPIAVEFVLLAEDSCYTVKTGYDEQYRQISPGHRLLEYMLQRYGKRPEMKNLNLMTHMSDYDYWKPSKINVYEIYICNKTLPGILAFPVIKLKHRARLIYRKLLHAKNMRPQIKCSKKES